MTLRSVATASSLGMAGREAIRAALDRTNSYGTRIPLRVQDATAGWLAATLDLPSAAITSVRVLDHHSGTAARARIAVESEADIPETLFLKLPPRNYLQHVLMNIFRLGTREIVAYRALGDTPPIRVPRCYAARIDQLRRRSVLVLEDLSATAQFRTVRDSVSQAEAEAVIDAMAALHSAHWGTDRFAGDLAPLAERSAADIRLGDIIRRRFLRQITGHTAQLIPETIKRQCHIFFQCSADIDAFWAAQPQTLIHGDPHLGNLFFESAGPGFLDWQIATAGAGIRDVAYFATASVEPDLLRTIEKDLVERYAAGLDAAGIPVDGERMWTLYRAGITEFYLAAVCTAEAGARMQPLEVSRVGVERSVAGAEAHDSFGVLAALIEGKRV